MVGPLPLALEPGGDRIVPEGLLGEAELGKARVSHHQVTTGESHENGCPPVRVLLGARPLPLLGIPVDPLGAILLDPGEGASELVGIEDFLLDPSRELRHVHHFGSHAQPRLQESRVHDGAGDAHGNSADGEVRLAPQGSRCEARAREAQELLPHVLGDGGIR